MMTNKQRFIFDTNVIVSALLLKQSMARQAFDKARSTGDILLSVSTLEELSSVLYLCRFLVLPLSPGPFPRTRRKGRTRGSSPSPLAGRMRSRRGIIGRGTDQKCKDRVCTPAREIQQIPVRRRTPLVSNRTGTRSCIG